MAADKRDPRSSGSGADDAHANSGGAKGGPDDPRAVPGNLDQSPTVLRPKDLTPPGAGPTPARPSRPADDGA